MSGDSTKFDAQYGVPSSIKPNRMLAEPGGLEYKKKACLAHEFGAGSSCKVCGDQCPGLELHYWRKICMQCKCRKEDHDLPAEDNDPGKIRIGRLFDSSGGIKQEDFCFAKPYPVNSATLANGATSPKRIGSGSENNDVAAFNYEWVPPGLTRHLIEKYMENLPPDSRPVVGSDWRRKTLEIQLPLHDLEASLCQSTDDEKAKMEEHLKYTKQHVVGIGKVKEHENLPETTKWNCRGCRKSMYRGDVAVFAERLGPIACFHPACFVCHKCEQLLADLIYFCWNDNIYCGRHYSESKAPRCAGCDELIFSREYTHAEDRDYHFHHFACFKCDTPLGGHRYMTKDGQPYCLTCYTNYFARTCCKCGMKITADKPRISHSDLHWHADENCFRCEKCQIILLNARFVLKMGHIFCGPVCKKEYFGV